MPKDAVGSQKVYVTLSDYTAAQETFNRYVSMANETTTKNKAYRLAHPEDTSAFTRDNYALIQARGMAQIIRTLKLPIDTSMVKP